MHVSVPQPGTSPHSAAKARSGFYVLFLASIAGVSGFLFGFDTAVINGVLLFLRDQFSLTSLQTELAASSLLLGCLLGAAVAGMLGDKLGRRKALLLAALLFGLSTLAAADAHALNSFCFGRLAGGLAIGLASVLTPIYIAEVAPARNRGTLVSINQLAIVIGILAAYFVSWKLTYLGPTSWRWMLAAAAVPSVLFFLGLLIIPESPRWQMTHGHTDAGMRTLTRIAGEEEAAIEARAIETARSEEGDGSWQEVFAPGMRRRLTIGLLLAIFSQITGINTVLYYGSVLVAKYFHSLGTDMALKTNIAIGIVNLLGTLAAMRFLDRQGRRTMLLIATAGMALSLTVLVVSLWQSLSPTLMLSAILAYVGFFAIGMGPVPWVILSEIFPNAVRGRASSLATSALWASVLLVTSTFLSLIEHLGLAGTFALYAALSAVSFIYILFRVPETRGKTLEQIQKELQT